MNKQTAKFLKTLDPAAAEFTFVAYPDRPDVTAAAEKFSAPYNQETHSRLSSLNQRGLAIAVLVQQSNKPGSTKNEDVTHIRAFMADKDDGEFDLKSFPLAPTMIVTTGHGQHAYWALREQSPDLKSFKGIQKEIAAQIDSDPNINNIGRIMRIPGYKHQKDADNPIDVRLSFSSDNRYSTEEIISAFNYEEPEAPQLPVGEQNSNGRLDPKFWQWVAGLNTGYPGDWNPRLFAAAKMWQRGGNTQEMFISQWGNLCPEGGFDEKDLNTIASAFNGDEGFTRPDWPKKENLISERAFVQWCIETEQITIKDIKESPVDIPNKLYLDAKEFIRKTNEWMQKKAAEDGKKAKSIPALHRMDMKAAYSEMEEKIIRQEISRLLSTLSYKGAEFSELNKFSKAMFGKSQPLATVVLAHFIWQVKQKMGNRKVANHLMPIIYNKKQGIGKSVAIGKLTEILNPFVANTDFHQIGDDRAIKMLRDNYIAVLDEMAYAEKADIDVLKSKITSSSQNVRLLYETTDRKIKQNCTFIGTSNRPLSDMIYDTTGMRRFFQLETLDRIDWKAINSIDYSRLWQEVDEGKPGGYTSDRMKEIQAAQKAWTAKDPVDEFLEENQATVPANLEDTVKVSVDAIYELHIKWRKEGGYKHIFRQAFSRRLVLMGFHIYQARESGSRKQFVNLNKDNGLKLATTRVGIVESISKKQIDN